MRYEEMSLDELYKEAFHTDNKLALHLFSHIDEVEGEESSCHGAYDEGYDAGWDDCKAECSAAVRGV